MSLIDPIGDMFTRIRNGQMRNLNTVLYLIQNLELIFLKCKIEGYINNYHIDKKDNKQSRLI